MEESQQKNEVYLVKSSYLYSEASPNDIQLPERITGGGVGWGISSFTNCLASVALEGDGLSHALTVEVECGLPMTLS